MDYASSRYAFELEMVELCPQHRREDLQANPSAWAISGYSGIVPSILASAPIVPGTTSHAFRVVLLNAFLASVPFTGAMKIIGVALTAGILPHVVKIRTSIFSKSRNLPWSKVAPALFRAIRSLQWQILPVRQKPGIHQHRTRPWLAVSVAMAVAVGVAAAPARGWGQVWESACRFSP
jgi:hypothetical protein